MVDDRHGLTDGVRVFLRCQALEAGISRQLDVDAQAVGQAPGFLDQQRVGIRYGLEVDVAAEVVLVAQQPCHTDQLFHGVVGRADDARTEKQAADAVAPVEVEGQAHDFLWGKARPWHVAGAAVDAVLAIVKAEVGQQHLEQRHTAPVGGVAVADPHAVGGAQAVAAPRAALGGAAAGTGSIVLGCVGKDAEFGDELHGD
ncbi:hypothetical protein D3C81_1219700 [compost metagenome]